MIQSLMYLKMSDSAFQTMYIPIKIGLFVWFPCNLSKVNTPQNNMYIYVSNNKMSSDKPIAILLNAAGNAIGEMTDTDFVSTSIQALESVIIHQTSESTTELWQQKWHPTSKNATQNSANLKDSRETLADLGYLRSEVKEKYGKAEDFIRTLDILDRYAYFSMLRVLFELGWRPAPNETFCEDKLFDKLQIAIQHRKQFGYFLRVFMEEGLVSRTSKKNHWKVTGNVPTELEVQGTLTSVELTTDLVDKFNGHRLLMKTNENLGNILRGNVSALNIYFSAKSVDKVGSEAPPSADEFYAGFIENGQLDLMVQHVNTAWLKHYTKSSGGNCKFRVLEIGAGTGGYTKIFLGTLKSLKIDYEFTYTDISSSFFPAAQEKFKEYSNHLIYKKLNLEEDPLVQDFTPEYYDLVLAFNVIHATRDLTETLFHVRTLLKPDGLLDLVEITRDKRSVTYISGLLDGFWRIQDLATRSAHCFISTEKWKEVLKRNGFTYLEGFNSPDGLHTKIHSTRRQLETVERNAILRRLPVSSQQAIKTWIIFSDESCPVSKFLEDKFLKLVHKGRQLVSVVRNQKWKMIGMNKFMLSANSEEDMIKMFNSLRNTDGVNIEGIIYTWSLKPGKSCQADIFPPLLHLTKSILTTFKNKRYPRLCVLVKGEMTVDERELDGLHASTVVGFCKAIQNEMSELNIKLIDVDDSKNSCLMQLFYELWKTDDAHVCFLKGARCVPKLHLYKTPTPELELPLGSDRFQLKLPKTRIVEDLQFVRLQHFDLQPEEIEIRVETYALNFMDVFNIIKPSAEFEKIDTVGLDFAGVVKRVGLNVSQWKVGDPVYSGIMNGAALPSHVKLHQNHAIKLPPEITMPEACTLPTAAVTSIHCLLNLANIKKGETVLIHTASGGVGLAAIQLCRYVGARVMTTAGSKRKQNYLKSLGVEHVFHSRDTTYSESILKVTKGVGVNVVLNSLTSHGFKEATLKACALNARFIEMSKLNIWKPEEVTQLRPDVNYSVVDVSSMPTQQYYDLIDSLSSLLKRKLMLPLPFVKFSSLNIQTALKFLQNAKHIGKVVCQMPAVTIMNGKIRTVSALFNARSTYLITGGLGGIGFEVCKWMLQRGAKHVLLAGRKPPPTSMEQEIAILNQENDADIRTVLLDVGNSKDCQDLVNSINMNAPLSDLPPLRGIMHAAGTLDNKPFSDLTWDSYSAMFRAKVDGTLNLHEATLHLRLEHFVLFSTFSTKLPSITRQQSNYIAANTFLDTFAVHRNRIGLPTKLINFGPWSEVGMVAHQKVVGAKPCSTKQGLTALEYLLTSEESEFCAFDLDAAKLPTRSHTLFDDKVLATRINLKTNRHQRQSAVLSTKAFWSQCDAAENVTAKQKIVRQHVLCCLQNILQLDSKDVINDDMKLLEMGIDSLMFIEIKNVLQALLGNTVVVYENSIRDCETVGNIVELLMRLIQGSFTGDGDGYPTVEEINELLSDDSILPCHVKPYKDNLKQCKVKVKDIERVLITGATGTAGSYVLKALAERKQIKEIICLVRPTKDNPAETRLKEVLMEKDLLDRVDMDKVRCITGNVALARMGLDNSEWERLSHEVDAVINIATVTRFGELYKKKDSDSDSRAVNIRGLINVLEFCCSGEKLKQIFHCSAPLMAVTLNKEGNLSEDWPDSTDFNGLSFQAYFNSKFVAELLMKEAVTKRGIPGKVFRLANGGGDSVTGQFDFNANHLMSRCIFFLKYGIMPNNGLPVSRMPLDITTAAAVELFLNEDAPNTVYNLINFTPETDLIMKEVATNLGFSVSFVTYSEFKKTVLSHKNEKDNPLALYATFLKQTDDEQLFGFEHVPPSIKKWTEAGIENTNFCKSENLTKYLPSEYLKWFCATSKECLQRDLQFALTNGMFKKFGI